MLTEGDPLLLPTKPHKLDYGGIIFFEKNIEKNNFAREIVPFSEIKSSYGAMVKHII